MYTPYLLLSTLHMFYHEHTVFTWPICQVCFQKEFFSLWGEGNADKFFHPSEKLVPHFPVVPIAKNGLSVLMNRFIPEADSSIVPVKYSCRRSWWSLSLGHSAFSDTRRVTKSCWDSPVPLPDTLVVLPLPGDSCSSAVIGVGFNRELQSKVTFARWWEGCLFYRKGFYPKFLCIYKPFLMFSKGWWWHLEMERDTGI